MDKKFVKNTENKFYTLTTGASEGIGKAMAYEFARKNFNLILIALPEPHLQQLAEDLKAHYTVDVKFLGIDLTETQAPQQVFSWCKQHKLMVNMLINNAGMGYFGKIEDYNTIFYNKLIQLNVTAVTLLTCLFLSAMKNFPKAYILNISSMAAFYPLPLKTIYCASKTYILVFSRALKSELKITNNHIQVSVVCPGGVYTNKSQRHRIQKLNKWAQNTVLQPEQVAKEAIQKILKGKYIIIPGLINRFIFYLGKIIPLFIKQRIARKNLK